MCTESQYCCYVLWTPFQCVMHNGMFVHSFSRLPRLFSRPPPFYRNPTTGHGLFLRWLRWLPYVLKVSSAIDVGSCQQRIVWQVCVEVVKYVPCASVFESCSYFTFVAQLRLDVDCLSLCNNLCILWIVSTWMQFAVSAPHACSLCQLQTVTVLLHLQWPSTWGWVTMPCCY
jgi:hypothetical protein